jgi:hypothetical protein
MIQFEHEDYDFFTVWSSFGPDEIRNLNIYADTDKGTDSECHGCGRNIPRGRLYVTHIHSWSKDGESRNLCASCVFQSARALRITKWYRRWMLLRRAVVDFLEARVLSRLDY